MSLIAAIKRRNVFKVAVAYSTDKQQRIQRQPTDSGEATALCIAAAEFYRRGQPEDVELSLARISGALDADSSFVDAWILRLHADDLIKANDALGNDDEVRYWYERARLLGALGPDDFVCH